MSASSKASQPAASASGSTQPSQSAAPTRLIARSSRSGGAALPNFLILGVAKCGSTSLYAYVDQHPDVFFSTPKEPVFFEAEYERGLDYYRERYFRGWAGQVAVGEARTHNLMLPFVAARIRESLPRARLVAVLRDPIDRAFSHWWHRYSRGLDEQPFFESMRANWARIERGETFEGPEGEARWRESLVFNRKNTASRYDCYLELGHYAEQIERYLELFPREQLHVVFFEDLVERPEEVTRAVWAFLGVDPERALEASEVRNAAQYRERGPLLAKQGQPAFLKRLVPKRLQRWAAERLAGRVVEPPRMEPEAEAWLIEYFAPRNRALAALLDRDLGAWLRADPRRTSTGDATV